jgi:Bacterial EndoU nuclease
VDWFLGKGRAVALVLACVASVLGAGVAVFRDGMPPLTGGGTATQGEARGRQAAAGPGPAQADAAVVTASRRVHILDGDARGGGHRPGRGIPGKSEFPAGWSDDRIIAAIEDVANDPASRRRAEADGRTVATGRRDGVDIRVVVERDGRTVVTGYPTNTPRNPER